MTFFISITECPPLTASDNGGINCLLGDDGQPSLGDTCTFTCDNGYKLSGSVIRSCQIDESWSGTEPVCIRGMLLGYTHHTLHLLSISYKTINFIIFIKTPIKMYF